MSNIIDEINKVRSKLKKGPADTLLLQKPFAKGMYSFSMFIVDYYSRVRHQLKIDFDSFMIVQTVVSHNLYLLSKKRKTSNSYKELEAEWDDMISKYEKATDLLGNFVPQSDSKLTISSICLVTGLPKETVRRKTVELVKRNLLINSKSNGITLGSAYKRVFQDFVPETVMGVVKLLKNWEKNGVLKNLLEFKI